MKLISINKKCRLRQMLCRHRFQEGVLERSRKKHFANLSGTRYTTVCASCGKVLGTRFLPNEDGS